MQPWIVCIIFMTRESLHVDQCPTLNHSISGIKGFSFCRYMDTTTHRLHCIAIDKHCSLQLPIDVTAWFQVELTVIAEYRAYYNSIDSEVAEMMLWESYQARASVEPSHGHWPSF